MCLGEYLKLRDTQLGDGSGATDENGHKSLEI